MTLREIAALSGRPGLFKILKPANQGVIVEELNDKRSRFVAGAQSRVSILSEISMYTTDADGSKPLAEILLSVHELQKGKPVELTGKSSGADFEEFFVQVLPNWDSDRVYASDIKKLVTWYNLLLQYEPSIFEELKPKPEPASAEPVKEEATGEEKPKTKAKKEAKADEPVKAESEEKPKPAKAKAPKKEAEPEPVAEEKPKKKPAAKKAEKPE